jgi:tRNA-specific 2-thiouridylase
VKTVAVAMSGGIDSALTAYLLQKEGYRVIGLHADFGFSSEGVLYFLKEITSSLRIPLEVIPLRETFREKVGNYFISEYGRGRTPNPCVVCNPLIKFGVLCEEGRKRGADFFATGHYARLVEDPWGKGLTIARGWDEQKEQSYFLHRVSKENLKYFLFPMGPLKKGRVREMWKDLGFPFPPKGESQDICFLSGMDYRTFLIREGVQTLTEPGEIVDGKGKKMGVHQGLIAYTVGQRRGLGIPGPEPYYVLRLDTENNRLVIGPNKELESSGCRLTDFHFLMETEEVEKLEVTVQIRYRHRPVRAFLKRVGPREFTVRFERPQKAVTPGQAGVVYFKDMIVGGGWIETVPAP